MKSFSVIFSIWMFLTFLPLHADGQRQVRSLDRSGNANYNDSLYHDAEMDYRRALSINPTDSVARFNLATTLIRQHDQAKLAEADSLLTGLIVEAEQTGNRQLSARSLYQKGEIAMMVQQYQQAADAFKESLKRNPGDNDARFNYLLAKRQLDKQNQDQNQDQNQQDQQQNQDQQQQQNQDQQDQDQNQDQNQQDQQQNQDQQQPDNQDQNQMSEDQRQSILEQNEREEKETQAKVMRRQQEQDKDKERERQIQLQNGTLKDW